MYRMIVIRNKGSSDSPSVLTIAATFTGFAKSLGDCTTRSVGEISSAWLSMSDTGMPEFVNRIYVPWLTPVRGSRQRYTFQGASSVSGLTSLPARCGKLDNALLRATLNLSMSRISGTTWVIEAYHRARS